MWIAVYELAITIATYNKLIDNVVNVCDATYFLIYRLNE
jgi:hypothetical protein